MKVAVLQAFFLHYWLTSVAPLKLRVKQELLRLHNSCRRADGQNSVLWDSDLERFAAGWAGVLAREGCHMYHSSDDDRTSIPGYVGKYVGENLSWGYRSDWNANQTAHLIQMATQGFNWWCDEKQNYNWRKNKCALGETCAHYTQVVWSTTRKIGCAIALCPNTDLTTYILACNYYKGGNIIGMKPFEKRKRQSGGGRKKNSKTRKVRDSRDGGGKEGTECVPSRKTSEEGDSTTTTVVRCRKKCKVTKINIDEPTVTIKKTITKCTKNKH